jgi:hypothetical protein
MPQLGEVTPIVPCCAVIVKAVASIVTVINGYAFTVPCAEVASIPSGISVAENTNVP